MPPRLIKTITIVVAVVALAIKMYKLWQFYTELVPVKKYTTLRLIGINIQFLTDITLAVIAVIIVLKSANKSAYYLALALAMFTLVGTIPLTYDPLTYIVGAVASTITGCMFIFSMQHFPVSVTTGKIDKAIRWSWLKGYLKIFLRAKVFWIGMVAALLLLSVLEYFIRKNDPFSTLLILFTGFAYLYVNFRTTAGIEHSRILWLFWGLAMYILMNLIYYSLYLYGGDPGEVVRVLIAIIMLLILFFSFVMSLFFANTFNTGVFVRRSVVNATLFLLIVFLYNTLEHYVLHWISHKLHVSDVIISSMLSGVLVLLIAPLHHRLTHYLNKKLKGGHR